jgi:arsenate reductase (thioredoxin)
MNPRIEVLYFVGCPHAGDAVERVRRVAARLVPGTAVATVLVGTGEEARDANFIGSPTVRVDGRDVEKRTGAVPGLSCRVYEGGGGIPPEWRIEAAILRALRPRHILFLCVANSARSQMAEGIARSLAPEGVKVSSAGSAPSSVRPQAIEVMKEIGIDISAQRSKGVEDIDASSVEEVITLCAEEVCPAFLGKATRLHWGLPDPAAATGTEETRLVVFRNVRDEILRRLKVLFDGMKGT